jgi:hypothetical protein
MSAFSSGLYSSAGSELQSELLPGETLLWAGQPSRKVIFHSTDWFSIPFSLLWGSFAIFWELGVTGSLKGWSNGNGSDGLFVLWGVPFVLIGQYMIWGRFPYTSWKKGRTYYAVTNKRIIVLNTAPSRKVTDRYFRSLDSVSISTRSDGIGTIEFSPTADFPSNWGWGVRSRRYRNQLDINLSTAIFHDIRDARNVYQLIQMQRETIGAGSD